MIGGIAKLSIIPPLGSGKMKRKDISRTNTNVSTTYWSFWNTVRAALKHRETETKAHTKKEIEKYQTT